MPARRLSIAKIRAELACVNQTPDPNKCGCRNVRCWEETGHKAGACAGAVATKFWTFRLEYYCAPAVSMDGVEVGVAATCQHDNNGRAVFVSYSGGAGVQSSPQPSSSAGGCHEQNGGIMALQMWDP